MSHPPTRVGDKVKHEIRKFSFVGMVVFQAQVMNRLCQKALTNFFLRIKKL